MASSSAGCKTEATTGGNAFAMKPCAVCGSAAFRTARKTTRPRSRSLRQPIKYKMPSMSPQAILQPSAPMSMVRISARSASAMLSEPVKVSTMIRPKSTSATRSFGSSTRRDDGPGSSGIAGFHSMVGVLSFDGCFTVLGEAKDKASLRRSDRPSVPRRRRTKSNVRYW